jgi:hypothetical protein
MRYLLLATILAASVASAHPPSVRPTPSAIQGTCIYVKRNRLMQCANAGPVAFFNIYNTYSPSELWVFAAAPGPCSWSFSGTYALEDVPYRLLREGYTIEGYTVEDGHAHLPTVICPHTGSG